MTDYLLTRRRLLQQAGTAVAALGLAPLALRASADAAGAAPAGSSQAVPGLARFLDFSRFATGHQALDEGVGQLLLSALTAQDPRFASRLGNLVRLRTEKGYADVEAMDADLAGQPEREALLKIIRAWYAGVIEDGSSAHVYAFQKALMYQPAGDVVVIPTFAHNGPNYWVAEPPPVDRMPSF